MNFSHCAEKIHPQDSTKIMYHAYILKNLLQPITLQTKLFNKKPILKQWLSMKRHNVITNKRAKDREVPSLSQAPGVETENLQASQVSNHPH